MNVIVTMEDGTTTHLPISNGPVTALLENGVDSVTLRYGTTEITYVIDKESK